MEFNSSQLKQKQTTKSSESFGVRSGLLVLIFPLPFGRIYRHLHIIIVLEIQKHVHIGFLLTCQIQPIQWIRSKHLDIIMMHNQGISQQDNIWTQWSWVGRPSSKVMGSLGWTNQVILHLWIKH